VKTIEHFHQNRPVHLARRDVFFEHASRLIQNQQDEHTPDVSRVAYEEILYLLQVARLHARFAMRRAGKNKADEQFGSFISLLAGNVQAVLSMISLKRAVESSEGSFFSFLGANHASVALQAEEYQRRASDITRSLHNTLKLAEEPFEQLKIENAIACTDEECERYTKARNHFTKLVQKGSHKDQVGNSSRGRILNNSY
jgi:N-methylhydantoinase A/oxoprolinase/acetone carboxylase beta subunit